MLGARQGRSGVTLRGVHLEVHGAIPAEDLVIETMWRGPLSMTNRSRRPRFIPVLASRATVVASRKTYLAQVYVEFGGDELSPDQAALAWAEFVLPGGVAPRSLSLEVLAPNRVRKADRKRDV